MQEIDHQKSPYTLPLVAPFRFALWIKILLPCVSLLVFLESYVFYHESVIISVIAFAFALFILYYYLMVMFGRYYLELTSSHIYIRNIFFRRKIYWREIVEIHYINRHRLGIITEEAIQRQQAFWTKFQDALQYGIYAMVIPMTLLKYLDLERLLLTIDSRVRP